MSRLKLIVFGIFCAIVVGKCKSMNQSTIVDNEKQNPGPSISHKLKKSSEISTTKPSKVNLGTTLPPPTTLHHKKKKKKKQHTYIFATILWILMILIIFASLFFIGKLINTHYSQRYQRLN